MCRDHAYYGFSHLFDNDEKLRGCVCKQDGMSCDYLHRLTYNQSVEVFARTTWQVQGSLQLCIQLLQPYRKPTTRHQSTQTLPYPIRGVAAVWNLS